MGSIESESATLLGSTKNFFKNQINDNAFEPDDIVLLPCKVDKVLCFIGEDNKPNFNYFLKTLAGQDILRSETHRSFHESELIKYTNLKEEI